MFGIDFSEILVIFGIALVVLGPEKLPRLARTVGRWVGRARAMARQFREQLEQEADALHRTADLRTPQPQSQPQPAPPPPATAAAAPPPPVASIVPDTGAPAADAVATEAVATDPHAHQQQPASPAAEPHERAG
jgi:sec-independent protein translocase protein TatB